MRHNLDVFSSRDAMRGTHIKTMDGVDIGIDILIERGYISPQTDHTHTGKGRPASATFTVNPKIFKH